MDAGPQQLSTSQLEDFEEVSGPVAAELAEPAPVADRGPPPSLQPLHEVPVRLEAVLGHARLRVEELLETRPGTVIELDRRVGEPVDLLVNGRLVARGELVLIDGALGVTLSELVVQER